MQATLLTGGIDELFSRTQGAQTQSFLTDALGSTVRLTDSAGTKVVDYTYEAYGKSTNDNPSSSNGFQYTGRENDNTNLYYYRNRYYHPTIGRFISEDPIGLAGGYNQYAYTYSSPTNFTDPTGHVAALLPFVPAILQAIAEGLIGTGLGLGIADLIFAKPPKDASDPNGSKAPGKPGADEGFRDPRGGEDWGKTDDGRGGWRDKKGKLWCPTGPEGPGSDAHGGPHWDVQWPDGSGHENIYPGGHRR